MANIYVCEREGNKIYRKKLVQKLNMVKSIRVTTLEIILIMYNCYDNVKCNLNGSRQEKWYLTSFGSFLVYELFSIVTNNVIASYLHR